MQILTKVKTEKFTPLELGTFIGVWFGHSLYTTRVLSHLDGTVLKFGTCDYKAFNNKLMLVADADNIKHKDGILGTIETVEDEKEVEITVGDYLSFSDCEMKVVYEDVDGNSQYAVDVDNGIMHCITNTGDMYEMRTGETYKLLKTVFDCEIE